MILSESLLTDAIGLRTATNPRQIVTTVKQHLLIRNASHILVTGLPMRNRAVDPLLVHISWPSMVQAGVELTSVQPGDQLISTSRAAARPLMLDASTFGEHSELVAAAGTEPGQKVLILPITSIPTYQGVVIAQGFNLALTDFDLLALEFLCNQAFKRLRTLNIVSDSRPGDLSARERLVLELTANGNTAQEIAEILSISQRTVHAHLQNAGEKLGASNKTQTVVEALRYGQITLSG